MQPCPTAIGTGHPGGPQNPNSPVNSESRRDTEPRSSDTDHPTTKRSNRLGTTHNAEANTLSPSTLHPRYYGPRAKVAPEGSRARDSPAIAPRCNNGKQNGEVASPHHSLARPAVTHDPATTVADDRNRRRILRANMANAKTLGKNLTRDASIIFFQFAWSGPTTIGNPRAVG